MTAMQERDIETLRFQPRGRVVHFVKARATAGNMAVTFCGRSDWASRIVRQHYSAVHVNDWCGPCYQNRRKAIWGTVEPGETTR